jgi:N-methylhydantoinase B/oxoprolinase/acetone carboxylase alpha subunit
MTGPPPRAVASDPVQFAVIRNAQLETAEEMAIMLRRVCGRGYGSPRERDPRLVLADVRDGKVSAARACNVYAVAIDTATWAVDEAETARLRGGR